MLNSLKEPTFLETVVFIALDLAQLFIIKHIHTHWRIYISFSQTALCKITQSTYAGYIHIITTKAAATFSLRLITKNDVSPIWIAASSICYDKTRVTDLNIVSTKRKIYAV